MGIFEKVLRFLKACFSDDTKSVDLCVCWKMVKNPVKACLDMIFEEEFCEFWYRGVWD